MTGVMTVMTASRIKPTVTVIHIRLDLIIWFYPSSEMAEKPAQKGRAFLYSVSFYEENTMVVAVGT
jgi:hypothetical protein